MKKVTILVPCYNEEESLPLFYESLLKIIESIPQKYEWELLFVNDGSRDRTLQVMRNLRERDSRVSYLDLSRNFGKERAMLAGFDYVTGDYGCRPSGPSGAYSPNAAILGGRL